MSTDDDEVTFIETTPPDVIEGRSPRTATQWAMRPWWLVLLLAVAVLAAGIGIGYALGRHTSKTTSGAPSATPAGVALAELPKLDTTGARCSLQPPGTRRLMLGVQVHNGQTLPIQFHDLRGIFPMGGMRVVDAAVGRCNAAGVPVPDDWLTPGGTTWLRITVDVLVRCPTPLPVQYEVDYAVDGAPASVTLAAFPDLGGVPYSGCN